MNDLKAGQAYQVLPISVGAVSETGQREQNQDSMTGFSSPFGALAARDRDPSELKGRNNVAKDFFERAMPEW